MKKKQSRDMKERIKEQFGHWAQFVKSGVPEYVFHGDEFIMLQMEIGLGMFVPQQLLKLGFRLNSIKPNCKDQTKYSITLSIPEMLRD